MYVYFQTRPQGSDISGEFQFRALRILILDMSIVTTLQTMLSRISEGTCFCLVYIAPERDNIATSIKPEMVYYWYLPPETVLNHPKIGCLNGDPDPAVQVLLLVSCRTTLL